MKNLRSWFSIIVAAGYLLGSAFAVPAAQAQQGPHAHGAVVGLKDTPHLWIADEHGVLHWGGDTRALAGKHIAWSNRIEVCLPRLRTWPVGDPWLSAGLLKDGAPIYQVKWETEWAQPKLLHIQSIKDVELFGIDGSNYGNYVIEKSEWERRFGIAAAGLERSPLAPAVEPPAAMPFPRGSEALRSAIWRGQADTVRTLVAAGAQLNVVDGDGDPFLREAIWRGHTEIVRILVDAGAEIDTTDSGGDPLLHEAIWRGHTEIVRILVDACADVNARDSGGDSMLHEATWRGHTDIAQILVAAGAQ